MYQKLTAEETVVIRKLEDSLHQLFATHLFNQYQLERNLEAVVAAQDELENTFPQLLDIATRFYYDQDEKAEDEMDRVEGYGSALTSVATNLITLTGTELTINLIYGMYDTLTNSLYDLKTFSEQWDVERGVWKD